MENDNSMNTAPDTETPITRTSMRSRGLIDRLRAATSAGITARDAAAASRITEGYASKLLTIDAMLTGTARTRFDSGVLSVNAAYRLARGLPETTVRRQTPKREQNVVRILLVPGVHLALATEASLSVSSIRRAINRILGRLDELQTHGVAAIDANTLTHQLSPTSGVIS